MFVSVASGRAPPPTPLPMRFRRKSRYDDGRLVHYYCFYTPYYDNNKKNYNKNGIGGRETVFSETENERERETRDELGSSVNPVGRRLSDNRVVNRPRDRRRRRVTVVAGRYATLRAGHVNETLFSFNLRFSSRVLC